MASSMGGQWLKTDGYLEFLDPVTRNSAHFSAQFSAQFCAQFCAILRHPLSARLRPAR